MKRERRREKRRDENGVWGGGGFNKDLFGVWGLLGQQSLSGSLPVLKLKSIRLLFNFHYITYLNFFPYN